MPLSDESIECRPPVGLRVLCAAAAVLFASMAIATWTLGGPWWFCLPISLVCLALGGVTLASALCSRVRADAAGLWWRDEFGRTRVAPWSAVTAVRDPGVPRDRPAVYAVEFADGRPLTWPSYWTHSEALRDRVRAALDRGSYRVRGDLHDDAPVRFSFARASRASRWGTAAMLFALGAPLLWLFRPIGYFALQGELGLAIDAALVFPVPLAFGLVAAAHTLWAMARAHGPEVAELDARGLTVTGGPSPFRASWNDVLAVTPIPAGGITRLHIATTAGAFTAPSDHQGRLSAHLRARVPPAVREVWALAAAAQRGDVATTLADGSQRHGFRPVSPAWALDACALLAINLPLIGALTLRPDVRPLDVPLAPFAAPLALSALLVLLHRVARAWISVAVSPSGCDWRGPWRRRRFAWGDVAEVLLPGPTTARIALRLTDGTRLWCLPVLLAGGEALVVGLRERCATPPFPAPSPAQPDPPRPPTATVALRG
ncbi:MAG: hypothetical protein JWM10_4676 [Myxococcaceae bacterium]|nr:hypothetical protein [Myxococcaceae bacterium]